MIKSPLVSILIPTYNRENFISKVLEVSCNQTYPNIEVVVVDNCSTDTTWEIIQEWMRKDARVKGYQNIENLGPVRNWAKCIEYATGEYSKILWSDDSMSLDFVEKTMELFDDKTAFVMSNIQLVNTDGETRLEIKMNKEYSREEYLRIHLRNERYDFPVSPGCAIFRTKDLADSLVISVDNHDGLDSSSNGAGNDLLLFLDTAIKYDKIKVWQEFGSFFTIHSDSFTIQNDLSLYYVWAKIGFLKAHNIHLYDSELKADYTIKFLFDKDSRYKNAKNEFPYTFLSLIIVSKKISCQLFARLAHKFSRIAHHFLYIA